MKHHLPPLDGLKVFEAAARHLSFSKAADELCMSKGAVSYQISKLEQTIDCALFKRAVRQVYLSEAGQTLFQTTQRVFADLEQNLAQLKPQNKEGAVYIGATTYVAMRWLSPRIASFNEHYPDIAIVLQHSVNERDFKIQDVDISIRWCELKALKDRKNLLELTMPLFPVCSPAVLQRASHSLDAVLTKERFMEQPFSSTPLLCEDRELDLWQMWFGQKSATLRHPRRIIADANVRTQAAIDGQGWTLADDLMKPEIQSGALVAPFAEHLQGYGYALMVAPGRYLSQNTRRLAQWLSS